ncbi:MAG: O-antigen ligase family protein [Fimbriimonadaceae bacterium]|nr:O-antigen ligase family protein [Fimbriimonadaceae bacterium]
MNQESNRFSLAPEFMLLLVASFLAPIIGGHVSIDPRPIDLGIFGEVFGGGALPYLSRLIIGLFVLGGLAILATRNRVIQLPNVRILILLTLFVLLLGLSIAGTDFKYAAMREWVTWFIYGGALFLTIGSIGRGNRPLILAATLGLGITIVGLRGIEEYVAIMAKEPTFRIFAGWTNPNAVASVFVVGYLLLTGLMLRVKSYQAVLAGISSTICLIALALTQSKGGYLAAIVGLVIFIAILLFNKVGFKKIGFAFVPLIAGFLLAFGLGQAASSANKSATAFARVTESGATAEQSVGFRQNLWKSAIELAKTHPTGTGVGTYRHYSTQPGLTESTVFAHQSYLQLAAEGGILTLVAFLAMAFVWMKYALRGTKIQSAEHVAFRAGVFAAAIGLAAHGMTESNLSFIGSGLLLFILVGLSLQLSTDGTSPEAVPKNLRLATMLVSCVAPLIAIAIFAASEAQKANLMTAIARRDQADIASAIESLRAGSYGDPDAAYMVAMYGATSMESRATELEKVATEVPSPRVLRATARAFAEIDQVSKAILINDRVFNIDPNNLKAYALKMDLAIQSGDTETAKVASNKLIEIESAVSYQVRAIPEAIPTETFKARSFLAGLETDPAKKAELLFPAIEGLAQYMEITAPLVKRMTDAGAPDYAGETAEDVRENLALGRRLTSEFLALYGPSGPLAGPESDSLVKVKSISKAFESDF